jgi:predicted CoA-binding protein
VSDGPPTGPSARERQRILAAARTVAIVGASDDPARPSHSVATYLRSASSYELCFVNPTRDTILGRSCYPDLASLPVVPDIVDVFRRPSALPAVLDEAIEVGARVLWLQLGLRDGEVARRGEEAGLTVVMDRCLKVDHARFIGGLHLAGTGTGRSRRVR